MILNLCINHHKFINLIVILYNHIVIIDHRLDWCPAPPRNFPVSEVIVSRNCSIAFRVPTACWVLLLIKRSKRYLKHEKRKKYKMWISATSSSPKQTNRKHRCSFYLSIGWIASPFCRATSSKRSCNTASCSPSAAVRAVKAISSWQPSTRRPFVCLSWPSKSLELL